MIKTEKFERELKRLDNSVKKQILKELEQLEENPFVGKPLGYSFLREKKVGGFRVYYLIYGEWLIVFVVALSDKKQQEKEIDLIKQCLDEYKEEVKRIKFEI